MDLSPTLCSGHMAELDNMEGEPPDGLGGLWGTDQRASCWCYRPVLGGEYVEHNSMMGTGRPSRSSSGDGSPQFPTSAGIRSRRRWRHSTRCGPTADAQGHSGTTGWASPATAGRWPGRPSIVWFPDRYLPESEHYYSKRRFPETWQS
jgi:hypothetical protein